MPAYIPFTGAPQEAMNITLAGKKLRLRVRYANLTNSWTLDIYDNSGTAPEPWVMGIPIVLGVELLKPYNLGIGAMVAEANADPLIDAGRGELGSRIRLLYRTPAEVAAGS